MGASWLDLSNVSGALDGLVGVGGIDCRVEIKNPDATRGKSQALKLTQDESDEIERWKGRTPAIVTTVDEAIELVNRLRRESVSLAKESGRDRAAS